MKEESKPKKKRGFASMDPEKQREIARKGGNAVVKLYGNEHMINLGKKGGVEVSKDRRHMAAIGKKGGEATRKTMAVEE